MKVGQITHEKALDFILAGKSFVTFQNPATGNRHTYKVLKHKTDDIYFVHVLTSPDVYMFLGSIKNHIFRYSTKSKIKNDSRSVIVFDYIFHHLGMNMLNTSIEIFHDGRCGKCGRQLTDPISVESGLGPYCRKK
jgi:hypothetical protein